MPNQEIKKNSVNLFIRRIHGKLSDDHDVKELERILAVNGISINTVVRIGATYEDLMRIPPISSSLPRMSEETTRKIFSRP